MSTNGYDFYLDKYRLPITPQKLQVKIKNANSTLTLINEGEINILKAPALTEIEFECQIPQVEYPFAVYPGGFQGASHFLSLLETLKTQKKPFQFIVSRMLPDGKVLFSTNMKVSLEDYGITEQAKDGFDLTVKIELKQYREYAAKTVSIREGGSGGTAGATVQTKRARSTVRASGLAGMGSEVIVNGRLHRDSYGGGPGKTLANYRGKVNFVNQKGSHPYHIISSSGGWLGWVTAGSIQEV